MKLLIIQPYLTTRGGAERVILQIAKHYDSKIYTLSYDKKTTFRDFEELEIKTLNKGYIPTSGLFQNIGLVSKLYNTKINEDYDVLNAHLAPSELIRNKNQRVLWYCHDTPLRFVYDQYGKSYTAKLLHATLYNTYRRLDKSVVKNIERIITNSAYVKENVEKYFNKEAKVIHPGIDYKEFSNERYGKYFLCISRIASNKNQKFAIDSYTQFIKRTQKKEYKLIIAGSISRNSEDLRYLTYLKERSKDLNIQFKINLGEKEIKNLYSNAFAVLFTSSYESFGLVPLEAMASSKPVIALDSGGIRETIINNKTGFIVKSEEEMSKYMKYLIENQNELETMGKEGRKLVEREYSWNNFFKKFDKYIQEVYKSY